MEERCICCNEREIKIQKRMLCLSCYSWLQRHGQLDEFPPIAKLSHNTRWREKYGPEMLVDLKRLVDEHHLTLAQVGEKYGVTRERIRQIFELLYGFKYTVAVKVKAERQKRVKFEECIAKRDPRYKVENFKKGSLIYKGAESEKKVFDICAALGYEIKPFSTSSIDLVINGYKVEIKSAHRTCLTNPKGITPLYHFKRKKSQEIADFMVCHAVPVNEFFVIPGSEFPPCGELYIPSIRKREWQTGDHGNSKRTSESKYYKYLEAWQLLKPAEKEVIFNRPALVAVNE